MKKIIYVIQVLSLVFGSTFSLADVPKKADVVIIGAGLSGLATAYGLKKAGVGYHVLELTPRIGGRVRTVTYQWKADGKEQELTADSGMEEYWESNPAVKILKELNLPVRHDVAVSSIVLNKKLYELGDDTPQEFQKRLFSAAELKAIEGFKKKLAAMMPGLSRLGQLKDVPFAKWVKDQGLPLKVSEWIRVSVECEIGTEWDRISAQDGIAEFHIFLGQGEESYRFIGGNEKFTDALAEHIGRDAISVNQRVNRIVTKDGKVFVYYLDVATNKTGVIEAKNAVTTIPLFRLSEVQFEPALSEKKRQAIASQSYGSYFKAHVFVPPSAEKAWLRGENSILPILSDSELGVIYDGNPDQPGVTKILSLLVTGARAEAFNFMDLDKVRSQIKAGFDKMWPGFSKQILGIEFYRYHPRAIAAWPVGRSRFDALSEEIRKPENHVYFAGDFTESSHSDGAFLSAMRVVKQIAPPKGVGK